jgi:hypothetical protein
LCVLSQEQVAIGLSIIQSILVNPGWWDSKYDHGFISSPYLHGEDLEVFNFNGNVIDCYWAIPIRERESDYKIEKGCEVLEQMGAIV